MNHIYKQLYREKIVPTLTEKFGYKNPHQLPKIIKIQVNRGLGLAAQNKTILQKSVEELRVITGQQPIVTIARKSIAGFKIRDDMPIGCKVTLRSDRMFEFLDRLISISIPRIRDFRGLNSKSFDGRGNYSMGVKEQIIFPEIDYDKIDALRGMDITITTTARTNEEGLALLKLFNFPFKS